MKLSGHPIKVSYVKINLKNQIISYNQNFINFFDLEDQGVLLGRKICELIPGINHQRYLKLSDLCENDKKSVLVFKNYELTGVVEPLVAIMYVNVARESDAIVIRVVNWLNWIWHINSSLNNSYNMITNMEEVMYRKKIRQLLEMYWFKALSPLLMHIPNGFVGMINSWACFDILKVFNNKRGENVFSKDYNRDTISRIRHSLKRGHGTSAQVDISDILKDNRLINLKYKDDLFIPHSVLEEDIILVADKDLLLEDIINIATFRDKIIE